MTSFVKIANQLSAGVKREFLTLGKVRLTLSGGFPYEAFGGNAVIRPWHILNMIESGRALSFNRLSDSPGEPFLAVEDLYFDYGIFLASARLTVAKEMYDFSIPKTPITLEKELVYVGKSSMNLQTDVLLPSRGLTLATCEVQSVLVDRQTRRPSPHPDWWREKFGGFTSPGRQLKVNVQTAPTLGMPELRSGGVASPMQSADKTRFQLSKDQPNTSGTFSGLEAEAKHEHDLPITEGVTSHYLTINSSDSDAYGHANWTASLKYCIDALRMETSPETSKLLESRALKSADIAFISEGLVGHRLNVMFWKDATLPSAVHFSIWDTDSHRLMSYAFLQFYSIQDVQLPISKL